MLMEKNFPNKKSKFVPSESKTPSKTPREPISVKQKKTQQNLPEKNEQISKKKIVQQSITDVSENQKNQVH